VSNGVSKERRRGPPWPTPPEGTHAVSDMKTWRRAITGDRGPSEFTTRLVLLTLSTFADFDGTNLFPGTRWIAKRAAISKDTAAKHRELAIGLGFLIPPKTGRHAAGKQIWTPSLPPSELQPRARKREKREAPPKKRQVAVSEHLGHRDSQSNRSVRNDTHDRPKPSDIPVFTKGLAREGSLVADNEFGF
jgi:hypothetical protein